jgi:hypothetical protein
MSFIPVDVLGRTKIDQLDQILTECCYELTGLDRADAMNELYSLDRSVSVGYNGLSTWGVEQATRTIIRLNLIKPGKIIELCKAIVNILFPNSQGVAEHFANVFYSFDPRTHSSYGLLCGFYEEGEWLAFYVMQYDYQSRLAARRGSGRGSGRGRGGIRRSAQRQVIQHPASESRISSMCNILEGLHGRITVLKRNRS